jgi:hypothetical protein
MSKARNLARRGSSPVPASSAPAVVVDRLLGDIRAMIEAAREQTALAVNSGMVVLNWSIGRRIRVDILQEKRAGYGERIVQTLSAQLTAEYGRGYGRQNLFQMVRFAEMFPDPEIVSTPSKQFPSSSARPQPSEGGRVSTGSGHPPWT